MLTLVCYYLQVSLKALSSSQLTSEPIMILSSYTYLMEVSRLSYLSRVDFQLVYSDTSFPEQSEA